MQPVSCLKKMQGGEHQASFKFISGALPDCTIYRFRTRHSNFTKKTSNGAELSQTVGQVKNAPTYFAMFSMTSGDCIKTTHCLRLSSFFLRHRHSSSFALGKLLQPSLAFLSKCHTLYHYSYLLGNSRVVDEVRTLIETFRNLLTLAYSYVTL